MEGGNKPKNKNKSKKDKSKKDKKKNKNKSTRQDTYIPSAKQLLTESVLKSKVENNNSNKYDKDNQSKNIKSNKFISNKNNIIKILNNNLYNHFINLLSENYDDLNSNYIVQSLLNYINDEFNMAVKNFELYQKFNIKSNTNIMTYNLLKLYYIMNTFKVDYLKKYLDNFDKIQKLVYSELKQSTKEFNANFKFDENDIDNSDILVKQYDITEIHPDIEKFVITHSKLFKSSIVSIIILIYLILKK